MTLQPIEDYEKYAVDAQNKVFGLSGKTAVAIVLKDSEGKIYPFRDFFTKNGKSFFSIIVMEDGTEEILESDPVAYVQIPVTHYYIQTGDSIEEAEEGLYPLVPDSNFVEMGISPFAIQTFNYEGMDTSRVSKNGKPTGFKMIDAYYNTPDGLWFSVPETIATRLKGIYFYPVVGNLSQSPAMSGRIW